ncbi:MAG TPA: MerR family transcriptional regulator [Longimicrobium sp.]|jgi:DNA-binding transcriptional MerR regulator
MTYRIKRVAHLTGINPATLRAWERRYQLLTPRRSAAGYRLYSDEDISILSRIKRLIDEGLSIGEALERVRHSSMPLAAHADAGLVHEVRDEILDALLTMDRPRAQASWERLESLSSLRRVDEVLMPVLREVGERWARGEIGVADEHYATAFAREKLAAIFEELDAGSVGGPLALCAGLPAEEHELGLMAAALHLLDAGWRVIYLGVNVPLDEIGRVAAERRPAMICTSVMRPMGPDEFHRLLLELRAAAPAGVEVVVGGSGIPDEFGSPPERVRVVCDLGEILATA